MFSAVNEKASAAEAWRRLPSWYVAGTKDASIPRELQLTMAERANSTVSKVKVGHLAMVSEPKKVAKVVGTAASSTR